MEWEEMGKGMMHQGGGKRTEVEEEGRGKGERGK